MALSLPSQELHIWRVDLDAPPPALSADCLSAEERRRAGRLVREIDRRRFIAGHAALRAILGRYLDLSPALVQFETHPRGKPSIHPASASIPLRFSLSHSERRAMVAAALDREVGVDIERVRSCLDMENIVRRYFAPGERAAWEALPENERETAFFRAWTRKEAYLKARGVGLYAGLDRFEVAFGPAEPPRLLRTDDPDDDAQRWQLFDVSPDDEYAAACVVEQGVENILQFDWAATILTQPGQEPAP